MGLQQLTDWVRRLFGIRRSEPPDGPDRDNARYEDIRGENITAIIANKLANFVFSDSTVEVSGVGRRAELIGQVIDGLLSDVGWITAQAFGKGGKVLVPMVQDGGIAVRAIDQNRMDVRRMVGGRIAEATLLLDVTVQDERRYYLLADYAAEASGAQVIRYRAVDEAGGAVERTAIAVWADIADEIAIENADRVLFAFLRCPRDNRRDRKVYGVPVTFGAEREIEELVEHMNTYRREYRLTRPMLGLDYSLWRNPTEPNPKPMDIAQVKRTVQDGDDPFIPVETSSLDAKEPWQIFSPAIRYEAMEGRYNSLCRRVEKACGLSQGILTERQTMNYANRDEVRAAMYDTFCVVRAMRDAWERALDDLSYAADVLAEHYGLTPSGARGQYNLEFDWDTSLIESTAETWNQNLELHAVGALSDAELRQWVRGGTLDEAEQAVAKVRADKGAGNLRRILSGSDPPEDE